MSHGKIRENKTCQNCGNLVEHQYCSYCGQENTETRQPFHYLFTHFIEDFVHYDGSFWTTIRNLFIKPGKITKEYLSGKRQSSVNPVKLYIFVSFITFFILAFFPSKKTNQELILKDVKDNVELANKSLDSLKHINEISEAEYNLLKNEISNKKSLLNNNLNEEELRRRVNAEAPILMPLAEKYIKIKNSNLSVEEKGKLFKDKVLSSIPKGLFIYMPVFAFVLWIFYNKKKWWYFDHGIYTLHYFSTLLLSVALIIILSRTSDWINFGILNFLIGLFNFVLGIYLIYIFYKGTLVLYQENKVLNFLKVSIVLFINTIIFSLLLIGILIYAFMNM